MSNVKFEWKLIHRNGRFKLTYVGKTKAHIQCYCYYFHETNIGISYRLRNIDSYDYSTAVIADLNHIYCFQVLTSARN